MNTCPEKEDLLLLAADELDAARIPALAAHLKSCEACRREVAVLRRGLRALECLDREPALPPHVAEAVRREAFRPQIVRFAQHLRWVAAAAAVLMVAGLGWHFSNTTHRDRALPGAVATQAADPLLELAAAVDLLSSGSPVAEAAEGPDPASDDALNEMDLILENLSDASGLQG